MKTIEEMRADCSFYSYHHFYLPLKIEFDIIINNALVTAPVQEITPEKECKDGEWCLKYFPCYGGDMRYRCICFSPREEPELRFPYIKAGEIVIGGDKINIFLEKEGHSIHEKFEKEVQEAIKEFGPEKVVEALNVMFEGD